MLTVRDFPSLSSGMPWRIYCILMLTYAVVLCLQKAVAPVVGVGNLRGPSEKDVSAETPSINRPLPAATRTYEEKDEQDDIHLIYFDLKMELLLAQKGSDPATLHKELAGSGFFNTPQVPLMVYMLLNAKSGESYELRPEMTLMAYETGLLQEFLHRDADQNGRLDKDECPFLASTAGLLSRPSNPDGDDVTTFAATCRQHHTASGFLQINIDRAGETELSSTATAGTSGGGGTSRDTVLESGKFYEKAPASLMEERSYWRSWLPSCCGGDTAAAARDQAARDRARDLRSELGLRPNGERMTDSEREKAQETAAAAGRRYDGRRQSPRISDKEANMYTSTGYNFGDQDEPEPESESPASTYAADTRRTDELPFWLNEHKSYWEEHQEEATLAQRLATRTGQPTQARRSREKSN
ncbi:unnamed protein product [Amoebophrya sp. A120]|nr:unnamed protein product [Amoebophrya sp. A120]|eukprot:GSA120T00011587001.1